MMLSTARSPAVFGLANLTDIYFEHPLAIHLEIQLLPSFSFTWRAIWL
jgi:hypothetical protein